MTSNARMLEYYENELQYLRTAGQEFAKKYPKVANRLELSADKNPDPHVERLLESFAFLAARIHQNIDDSVSDLASNVLEQLYPHAVRPLPSSTIACFEPDNNKGSLETGYRIERDTKLFAEAEDGATLHFKTSYPVTLWPLTVSDAAFLTDKFEFVTSNPQAQSVLKISLAYSQKFDLGKAALSALRFYLKGNSVVTAQLCDLLIGHTLEVLWRGSASDGAVIAMPKILPRFIGLEPDESLLPENDDTHAAYRLLLEYFAFPLKFQFFDIDCSHLGKAGAANLAAGNSMFPESARMTSCELFFVFKKRPEMPLSVQADDIRLGCTPLINLFSLDSEPLRVTGKQSEYRLVPDVHRERTSEIYNIESVFGIGDNLQPQEIPAYYSVRNALTAPQQQFWHARRCASFRSGMAGSDMNLTFIDTNFDPAQPIGRMLSAKLLCTNRGLARQLGADATLKHEDDGPIAEVKVLHKPTSQYQPSLDGAARWKLVSQLSINHLSIAEGAGALNCLKEILTLNNLSSDLNAQRQIHGITQLSCRRVTRHVAGDAWQGYRQGYLLTLQFDTACFRGSSKLIFGTILHRFLSMFAGINTFIELAVEGDDYAWPALPTVRIAL